MNVPVGIKRREVIDKTKRLTPNEKVESLINCQLKILDGKLKHESFLLEGETLESIEEEKKLLKKLLKIVQGKGEK